MLPSKNNESESNRYCYTHHKECSAKPLSQIAKPKFDEFKAYCQQKNYACGNDDWPWTLYPFEDTDPEGLARYESEVYSTYWAQGIDLNSIVRQGMNNPLIVEGQKGAVAEMIHIGKSNPLYGFFLKNAGLEDNLANREAYYLVKMILKRPDAFKDAIDQCGEWCIGSGGKIKSGESLPLGP